MWRKSRPENKISAEVEEKVENAIQELFWKLVKLRVKPDNERITVLVHGAANMDNIMFSYDLLSGRPNQVRCEMSAVSHHNLFQSKNFIFLKSNQRIFYSIKQLFQAKLVDFATVTVSSPVIDLGYFLYSSVHPLLISEHYVALLQVNIEQEVCLLFFHLSQAYHNAHLEAIKGFGLHGYEMDFEVLIEEYQVEKKNLKYGSSFPFKIPIWFLNSCNSLIIQYYFREFQLPCLKFQYLATLVQFIMALI